jgi:hypothetical protein
VFAAIASSLAILALCFSFSLIIASPYSLGWKRGL